MDADGRSLLEGGGSTAIRGNDRFRGAGHNAVSSDDAQADGWPRAQIQEQQ